MNPLNLKQLPSKRFSWWPVTYKDLQRLENNIMSAIGDYVLQFNAFEDRLDAGLEVLKTEATAILDELKRLQTGGLSAEDQAAFEALKVRQQGTVDKVQALVDLEAPAPTTALVPVSSSVADPSKAARLQPDPVPLQS